MALHKCRECGRWISTRAKVCPKCGAPVKRRTHPFVAALAVLLMILCCSGIFSHTCDSKNATPPSADTRPVHLGGETSSQMPGSAEEVEPTTIETQVAMSDTQPAASEPVAAAEPLDSDVTMRVKVDRLPGRMACIRGTTSLPPGTLLTLSVEERGPYGFRGTSSVTVGDDGTFQSEPIGPAGGLEDGLYVAEALMPLPRVQPEAVRRVLGRDGEHLSGPLVEESEFGKTVSVTRKFKVGGDRAARAQKDRGRARAKEYRRWLEIVVAMHKRLEDARAHEWLKDESKSENLRKWGNFARQFSKDMKSYQAKVGAVEPSHARVLIAAALGDVDMMFVQAAFEKPEEYEKMSAMYAESLADLKELVAKAEEGP